MKDGEPKGGYDEKGDGVASVGDGGLRFNLNDQVTVVPTRVGEDVAREYYARLHMDLPASISAGKPYRSELWDVMLIWGAAVSMGSPVPIETEFVIHAKPREAAPPPAPPLTT